MYYPKSQVKTNLYTKGGEYIISNSNSPYSGYYYQTSNGEYFSGRTPNESPSFRLIKVNLNEPVTLSSFEFERDNFYSISEGYSQSTRLTFNLIPPSPPKQSYPIPSDNDYKLGEFQRYFLKKRTNYTYLEVDQLTYENIVTQNPISQYELYQGKAITWILTGKLLEVYKINYNITELVEKRDEWLGFSRFFKKNFTKYFSFEASSPVFLYTKGSELKLESTDEDYIGYYNISPIGRIIAGKSATRTTQEYLIPYKGGEKINQSRSVATLDNEVGTSRRQNIPFTPR
jgi:hypothetical protein